MLPRVGTNFPRRRRHWTGITLPKCTCLFARTKLVFSHRIRRKGAREIQSIAKLFTGESGGLALDCTSPANFVHNSTEIQSLFSHALLVEKQPSAGHWEAKRISIQWLDGRRWNLVQRLCCNNSNLFYFSSNNPRGRLLRKVKIETHSRQTTRFGVEWRGYMLAPQVQREPWHCCSTRPHFPSFFRIFYEFIVERNSVNWISGCCWQPTGVATT